MNNVLNDIINKFNVFFIGGVGVLQSPACRLFYFVVAFDLIYAVIANWGRNDPMKITLTKIIKYGLIYYLILNYSTIIKCIFETFTKVGLMAGGNGISAKYFGNPALFSYHGDRLTRDIFAAAKKFIIISLNPTLSLTLTFCGVVIFVALALIGINFILTYVSFYTFAVLSLFLIPFGAHKYTSWIAKKVMNGVFVFAVQLMVLSFLASTSIPIIESWVLPAELDMEHLMPLIIGSLTLCLCSWYVPKTVATFISGMPAMNANEVGQQVASAASTVSQVITAGASGAIRASGSAGNEGLNATKNASRPTQ